MFRLKTGTILQFDTEQGQGTILFKGGTYHFDSFVVTRGPIQSGTVVGFQSFKEGFAHNVIAKPNFIEHVFPPTADPLDTVYFYSSR